MVFRGEDWPIREAMAQGAIRIARKRAERIRSRRAGPFLSVTGRVGLSLLTQDRPVWGTYPYPVCNKSLHFGSTDVCPISGIIEVCRSILQLRLPPLIPRLQHL